MALGWFFWKLCSDWLPVLFAATCLTAVAYFLWFSGNGEQAANGSGTDPVSSGSWLFSFIGSNVLKGLATLATVCVAFVTAGRALVFGSTDSAKFYYDLSHDPLKRVKKRFRSLIDATDMPVCVFIDDLDRCNADFVVDLLEGIQTSFRHPKVAYVVAADKTWIRSSFENRYSTFNDEIGDAGQPLGYLFLEKIFQLSVPVPGMGVWKKRYFESLLHGTAGASEADPAGGDQPQKAEKKQDEAVQQRREEIRVEQGGDIRQAGIEAALQDRDDDITRAALVLEYTASKAARQETEHLLARFTTLLPDNPRVMKRMINAFGMRYAIGLLERSNVSREVLARWALLEQRFPALADLLVEHPDWVGALASPEKSKSYDEALTPFLFNQTIGNILTGELSPDDAGGEAGLVLDEQAVRKITRGAAE